MLIYSKDGAKIDGVVGEYRNPEFFEKVERVQKVKIVGDYPHIEQAYQDAGIEIDTSNKDSKSDDTSATQGAKPRRTTKTA